MPPQIPMWVLGYTAAAGFGLAVLLWRIWIVTPPLEFTLLTTYGYCWLVVTSLNWVARRVGDGPMLRLGLVQ